MILAVDVGNTQIEVGIFEEKELVRSWRIATGVDRTEDEFMMFIHHFLDQENIQMKGLEGVAISSVVPNVTFIFQKMCRKYMQLEPLVVDHLLKMGITICYQNPAAVGADRLCSAAFAWQQFGQAVVAIDFGTATTFDVVNGKGEYLGGIISPGVETTAWSLYRRAAKLPKINLEFPEKAIGRTTEQSMQSGIMLGTVKMLEGMLLEIEKELQETPHVIATGGLARLIQPRTDRIELFFPHLVLQGLNLIFLMNQ
ncbi:MAG: type III pantothenate kinase [Calditrichia bacterium]